MDTRSKKNPIAGYMGYVASKDDQQLSGSGQEALK
jgi:hypothetical protein